MQNEKIKLRLLVIALLFFVGFIYTIEPVSAEVGLFGQCFCKSSESSIKADIDPEQAVKNFQANCTDAQNESDCPSGDGLTCKYIAPGTFGIGNDAEVKKTKEDFAKNQCNEMVVLAKKQQEDVLNTISAADAEVQKLEAYKSGAAITSKIIPECLLSGEIGSDKDTSCRDTDIFIKLGINIANYLFGIIGAVALLMFVYGGVMLIISGGSQERVKTGTDAMLAAVIGIVIVFSAYLLVGFIIEAIGVQSSYNLF